MVESTGSDDIINVPPSPFSCAFLCTGSILGRLFALRYQDDSSSRLLSHFLSSSQFQPESQNGVSLAVIGSLTHHGSRERENVVGKVQCSDWPGLGHMLTLGTEGVSAPLDHRAEGGSGRRNSSLRRIQGQTNQDNTYM